MGIKAGERLDFISIASLKRDFMELPYSYLLQDKNYKLGYAYNGSNQTQDIDYGNDLDIRGSFSSTYGFMIIFAVLRDKDIGSDFFTGNPLLSNASSVSKIFHYRIPVINKEIVKLYNDNEINDTDYELEIIAYSGLNDGFTAYNLGKPSNVFANNIRSNVNVYISPLEFVGINHANTFNVSGNKVIKRLIKSNPNNFFELYNRYQYFSYNTFFSTKSKSSCRYKNIKNIICKITDEDVVNVITNYNAYVIFDDVGGSTPLIYDAGINNNLAREDDSWTLNAENHFLDNYKTVTFYDTTGTNSPVAYEISSYKMFYNFEDIKRFTSNSTLVVDEGLIFSSTFVTQDMINNITDIVNDCRFNTRRYPANIDKDTHHRIYFNFSKYNGFTPSINGTHFQGVPNLCIASQASMAELDYSVLSSNEYEVLTSYFKDILKFKVNMKETIISDTITC